MRFLAKKLKKESPELAKLIKKNPLFKVVFFDCIHSYAEYLFLDRVSAVQPRHIEPIFHNGPDWDPDEYVKGVKDGVDLTKDLLKKMAADGNHI